MIKSLSFQNRLLKLTKAISKSLVACGLVVSSALYGETWIPETPLKTVYEAVYSDAPQSAWSELIHVLQNATPQIQASHWKPLFWEVIANTQCGRLLNSNNPYEDVRLVVSQRTTPSQDVYQLKVSLSKSMMPVRIMLTDAFGKELVTGQNSTSKQGYVEFEGQEQMKPIDSGLYVLRINETIIPVVLHNGASARWVSLSLEGADNELPFQFSLPNRPMGCRDNQVSWQWFDEQYHLIGANEPVEFDSRGIFDKPSTVPTNANWLSAVVAKKYWYGNVKIIQQQRATLPKRYFRNFL